MRVKTVASRAARPTRASRQRGGGGKGELPGQPSRESGRVGLERALARYLAPPDTGPGWGVLIQWYYAPSEWKVAVARHVPEPLRGEAEHYLRDMLYRMEVAEWFRKAPARTAAT